MQLTVIGCGDAFGSGARIQTCYHVAHSGASFLIDCGATTLIGLEREGIDPNSIGTIFITHLHGDHFSGLVWWLIYSNYIGKRTAPLARRVLMSVSSLPQKCCFLARQRPSEISHCHFAPSVIGNRWKPAG
jgi:ribonuclease BN (tRNA processing enzyme)